MRARAGAKIVVRRFAFEGARLLPDAALRSAVAPYVGRPLDFNGLRAAPVAVAAAYRRAGWIVRTYLPVQDIRDGVVTIQVVEARFGTARAVGRASHIRPRLAIALATAPLRPGEPISAAALDRGLLLAGDLPGVNVVGALGPGTGDRQTDLTLTLSDSPLVSGAVTVDNGGERATGAARGIASLSVAGLLGRGEALDATAIHSRGADYLGGEIGAAAGSSGLRLAIAGSYLRYRLTAADFAALNATGDSTALGVSARYPLVRSRARNLFLTARFQHKTFRNDASGQTVSRYGVDEGEVSLAGNLFDRLGGTNTVALAVTLGALDLDGSPNAAVDALTTRAAGRFGKFAYTLGRRQPLGRDIFATVDVSGQLATKNLDSSEKIYLGGPDSVRAYPANEAGGAEGEMVDVAIERRLPRNLTLTAFYDWGHVTINRDNRFAGGAPVNAESLQGAGITVSWRPVPRATVRATWSHRLGENPNPTAFGFDQDGSLVRNRIWVVASFGF